MIIASWYARSGQLAAGEGILTRMAVNVPEASIALPGLLANINKRPTYALSESFGQILHDSADARITHSQTSPSYCGHDVEERFTCFQCIKRD